MQAGELVGTLKSILDLIYNTTLIEVHKIPTKFKYLLKFYF